MMYRALLLGLVTSTAAAAQTLRGSRASVDLMYSTAEQRDLQFFRTPDDIYAAAKAGSLELISMTEDLEVDKTGWPFVLPNTHRFADSLATKFHAACGERLVVTSGARPLDKQPRNASPKSVHPTGMAVDFRKPKTPACLEWLRKSLVDLEDTGAIEATEERHPPHFHVAVLKQKPERHIQMAAGDVALPPAKPTATKPEAAKSKTASTVSSAKTTAAKSATPKKRKAKAKKSVAKKTSGTTPEKAPVAKDSSEKVPAER